MLLREKISSSECKHWYNKRCSGLNYVEHEMGVFVNYVEHQIVVLSLSTAIPSAGEEVNG